MTVLTSLMLLPADDPGFNKTSLKLSFPSVYLKVASPRTPCFGKYYTHFR